MMNSVKPLKNHKEMHDNLPRTYWSSEKSKRRRCEGVGSSSSILKPIILFYHMTFVPMPK